MKPLYISLNRKPSINYIRLIAGIIMMVGTIYLYFREGGSPFRTYQLLLLFVFGIYYSIMGSGINLISYVAKVFIAINDENISVKPNVFGKKRVSQWSDVSEIQINITAIRIKLKNTTEFQFEYQMLDDETVHTLKAAIIHQAKTNSITIS